MSLTVSAAGRRWQINNPGGRIGKRLANGAPYEKKLLEQIRQRGLSGSALDVGAHVGNHTLYLAIVCGLTVHAFEGNAERIQALRDNVALNTDRFRVLDDRIQIHPYAVGAESGQGWWADGRYMTLDTSDDAAERYGDHPRNVSGPVEVRRVDDLVDLDDLVLVKLDIEGMEPAALEGMTGHLTRNRPLIYSETHTPEAHEAQAAILEPLGYRMTGTVSMGSAMERWEP